MRILHVIRSDGFAGVERYVSRLAGQQARDGDEVIVVGGDQRRMAAALRGVGPTIQRRRGDSLAQVVPAVARLAPGADVVHVHMTAAELGAAPARLPWRVRTPIVSTRHFASTRGTGHAGRAVGAIAGQLVDVQIAVSQFVADHVEGAATVVYPGVDRRPDATPASVRAKVVLVVQRLEVEKETTVALEAFAAAGIARTGWRLQLAGDGAQRGDLERLAARLGLTASVDFLGVRDDVPALMTTAGVLLASPPAEPLGLSVVEAMAIGLPVAATASGGHLETLPTEARSAMFAPGDVAGAAAVLVSLASDPGARDNLAAAGQVRQRAAFTLAAQAAGTRAVYRDVLTR